MLTTGWNTPQRHVRADYQLILVVPFEEPRRLQPVRFQNAFFTARIRVEPLSLLRDMYGWYYATAENTRDACEERMYQSVKLPSSEDEGPREINNWNHFLRAQSLLVDMLQNKAKERLLW